MIFNQNDKRLHFYLGGIEAAVVIFATWAVMAMMGAGMPDGLKIAGGILVAAVDGFDKEQDDKQLGTGTPEFMDWFAQAFGGLVVSLAITYGPWMATHPLQFALGYLSFIGVFIVRMLIAFFWLISMGKRYHMNPDRFPWWLKLAVAAFIVTDVVMNYCLTFLCWDLPRQWDETVSSRLGRYISEMHYRHDPPVLQLVRYRLARIFCPILGKADRNHCRNNHRPRSDRGYDPLLQ